MSLIQTQMRLEYLYNKNSLMKRIKEEFTYCKEFDFCKYILSKNISQNFGLDLLAQMALRKRCELPVLVGLLKHHFHNAQLCADMLIKCAELDLVDWNGITFITKFNISNDVQHELDMFQYPLPLVVAPLFIRNNNQTGMHSLTTGSIILKNNHHDNDVCLDHINRMNATELSLDMRVVKFVKNQWRNLDKPKEGETRESYYKRVKAFNKYDKTAHKVISIITEKTDNFYLSHKYDKRGRTYCQGYHVNYQGNDWNKACVVFANKELLND